MINKLCSIEPIFKFTKNLEQPNTFYYSSFYSKEGECLLSQSFESLLTYEYIYLDYEYKNILQNREFLKNLKRIEQAYLLIQDESKELFLRYILRKYGDLRFYLLPIDSFKIYNHPCLNSNSTDVIIDCGSYDDQNIQYFKYKELYAIEPNKERFDLLNTSKKFNVAISNYIGESEFFLNEDSSSLSRKFEKSTIVNVTTLDELFKLNTDITYIKMDIEGEELKALKGGENLIKRCRPKLAISLYHNDTDFFEIPNYLQSLRLNYKFYLSNHSLKNIDFVLYGI